VTTVGKIAFVKPISDISLIAQNNIILSYTNSNSLENDIIRLAHDVTDIKNPTILLLLVPLSGYILFRSEEEKFQFFNTRKILSFCFIVILISSTVVTPISVSPGFLSSVYAETMNGTSTNATNSVENNVTLPLQSTSNTTQIGPQSETSNDTLQNTTTPDPTLIVPTNSTQTNSTLGNNIPTNDTSLTIPTNSTSEANPPFSEQVAILDQLTVNSTISTNNTLKISTNDTSLNIPANSTSEANPPFSEQVAILDQLTVNSTSIPSVIPNATKSWEFNSIQNLTTVGSAKIQNNTNMTSLKLAGSGYLTENVNSTRNLSELTISAWVKPDYSQGSPQFTIISKENQFTLSINNIISPAKIATFSVFDGIKWSTVNSTVPIEENWTQLAATFNGSSISIYVNGTLQSTHAISYIPTLAVNGQLTTKTVDQISSDADIVIGAYLNTLRGAASNKFSGSIQNVNLYDSLLSPSQIAQLYSSNALSGNSDILTNIVLTNSTNLNTTSLDANSTDAITSDLSLHHDPIEIGLPVTWIQNVTFSNQTDKVAIELPADAQILQINSTDGKNVTSIFKEQKSVLPQANPAVSNVEMHDKNLNMSSDKLMIIQNLNASQTIPTNVTSQFVVLDNQSSTPLASLDQVSSMVQQDKPTKMLVINDTANGYNVKFETPAPYTLEQDLSTPELYSKNVTVTHNSTLHYTDVKSYSSIPEDLVAKGKHFKLYWMINGSKVDVTNDPRFAVTLVDTNSNGIADKMQWTVPKLSEQQFLIEAQITIINIQSYPLVGGTWTVKFNTTGTANLTISAINDTTWSNSNENNQLKFLDIKCGDQTLSYQWINDSVFIPNYSCNDTGYETSKELIPGVHHLMFQFGDSVGYANNDARVPNFKVSVGSFNATTSSSIQNITGIGFQPKAIIVYWTNETAPHDSGLPQNNIQVGFGFGNGTALSQQRAITIQSDDGVTTSNANRNSTTNSFITIETVNTAGGAMSPVGIARLNYLGPDGFGLYWQKIPPKAVAIHYIAFGGSDLKKAGVGEFDATAGAGTQAVTGTGWKPDFLMLMSSNVAAASLNQPQTIALLGIGFATNPLTGAGANQTSVALTSRDAIAPSQTWTRTNQTGAMNLVSSTGADITRANVKSFDTNGFTISKVSASAQRWYYLALQGGHYSVGNFTKSTSTGSQVISKTGMGMTPSGLILFSNDKVGNATNAVGSNARLSFGAGNGTAQGSIWLHDTNGLATTSAKERESTHNIAIHGTGTTLDAKTSLTSLDANGFTLNWGTNNAVAQQIMYVAFGPTTTTMKLDESLTSSDTISTTAAKKISLSESLTSSDTLSTKVGRTQSLSESLTSSDVVSTTAAKQVSLSETLTSSDTISTTAAKQVSLSETLTSSDTISTTAAKQVSLSETLTSSDTISTKAAKQVSL
ncbi:MAG TPA: LamG domain-containing protein, partial [Nitrosopumilaceae archaeon]|nr:LamG domain-containing protein [Nitrosopumilaceae archaeon]